MIGLAEFISVHPQDVCKKDRVVEALSDLECLACPACRRSEAFLRRDGAQRYAEGSSAVREQDQALTIQVSFGCAGFQAGNQWPQFVDRVHGASGLAGDFSEANGGVAELEHRGEVDWLWRSPPAPLVGQC
jgi:hypothetical protein